MKKGFEREFLLEDVLWGPSEGIEIVRNEISGCSRWSITYDLVFKYEGKYWETSYSVGATEHQDESPWQYDGDMISCTEVEPYKKEVTDYRPVEQ